MIIKTKDLDHIRGQTLQHIRKQFSADDKGTIFLNAARKLYLQRYIQIGGRDGKLSTRAVCFQQDAFQ